MTNINVEKITHRFVLPDKREFTAIEDFNLQVKKGEFIVVIGESGCGKSTLLNLIAGLLQPTSGHILVNGKPVKGPHFSRMMMFQRPCLLPWLTVEENIAFGCKIRGERNGSTLQDKVADLIRQMGLQGFEKVYPDGLSAGMLQRTALARSLIGRPEILLLDECFSEIDVFTRSRLLQMVIDVWRKLNLSVLHVTHDIEEGLLLGQRVVLMGGRPGTVKHIFDIDLPYPRQEHDPKLIQIQKEILEIFHDDE
jgi:ABC-type nitrate/sulfonate/bicarbonate transport system ATPase subunit